MGDMEDELVRVSSVVVCDVDVARCSSLAPIAEVAVTALVDPRLVVAVAVVLLLLLLALLVPVLVPFLWMARVLLLVVAAAAPLAVAGVGEVLFS
jgi:hypothetical protein